MPFDIPQVEVIINSIINMNQKMQIMENKFQAKVESLEEETRQLYKRIEMLTEINTRNEMEKEDEKSFINKLYRGFKKLSRSVKLNEDYITTLFENDENHDDIAESNNENIKSLFQNCELYEEQIAILFENNVKNDDIMDLVEKDKINAVNIDVAFKSLKQHKIDEENVNEIKADIDALFKKDKRNVKNIKSLFNNCELYSKQIEILFDNENDK